MITLVLVITAIFKGYAFNQPLRYAKAKARGLSLEAKEAGRKGGETVSQDREHMSEIGREGGKSSHKGAKDE